MIHPDHSFGDPYLEGRQPLTGALKCPLTRRNQLERVILRIAKLNQKRYFFCLQWFLLSTNVQILLGWLPSANDAAIYPLGTLDTIVVA
jgi:hypothetical protein